MATWARGVNFKNSKNTKNIGGIGVYGNDTTTEKLYIGLGEEPWNNVGLQLTNNAISFKGNKIYHAGDMPSLKELGAAAASHNHDYLPLSGGERLVIGTASSTSSTNAQIEILAPNSGIPRLTFHSSGRSRMSIGATNGDMLQFTTERAGTYRIANANGYVDIGTQNTTYAHYNTDRPNHWFNTTVRVNGEIYAGSNYSQRVYHTGYKPSVEDIGAAASNHNHDSSYLKLSGGTMSGKITTGHNTSTYLQGNQGNAIINTTTSAGSYVMLHRYPSTSGFFTVGGYQGKYLLQYTNKATVEAGTNGVTKTVTLLDENGNSSFAGTVTASSFSGTLSGNASTANTLKTARTINGTSFNGSANIITENWGASRTITIGNTSKPMNGSADISWSLAEIGASASNHNHSLVSLSSETFGSGNDLNTYNSNKMWVGRTTNTSANRPDDYYTVLNVGAEYKSNFQLAHSYGNSSTLYVRGRHDTSGNYTPWAKVYTDQNKPTPSDIGASASNHNHDTAYLGKTAKAESAKTADSVAWNNISGKPSTFPPDAHSHSYVPTSDYSLTTISKTLTIGTNWMDTGITGATLATGSYMVQVSGMSHEGTSFYSEIWTGVMSWYRDSTNSTDADEIVLHKAGHASNGRTIYLRTLRVANSGTLKLQICASAALSSTNVTFKFRKLI